MFIVVVDRVRQRVMTTVRILFLLALVAVLTGQLFGLFRAGEALRSGAYPAPQVKAAPGQVQGAVRQGGLIDNLTSDLEHFYLGHN